MPFLAKQRIREEIDSGRLILDADGGRLPLNADSDKCLQQSSYDLRLGDEVYIVGKKTPDRLSKRDPYLNLTPGQFALLTTLETLDIPDKYMAFITIRSHFKFQGLVNISGFHVDPTYKGKLLFAVQNVGPSDIRLKYLERTFTIFFATVDGEVGDRRRGGISGIELDKVQLLGGASVTMAKLKKDLDQLRFIVLIYIPVVVAVLGALLKFFWPGGTSTR